MSERHPGRLPKKPAALLAGVVLFGGLFAASSTAGAVVVRTPVDFAVSNVASAPKIDRTGSVHDTMTISNLSGAPARATITLTVAGIDSSTVVPDAGITCAAPVGTATGFTRVCSTDAPLAAGSHLDINFDLVPSTSLAVHSLSVKGRAVLINTAPATLTDPVLSNNTSRATVAIGTAVDFGATITGAPSVLRTDTTVQTLSITNSGINAAPAKFVVRVNSGLESSFSADAGMTCAAPVLNTAGTGFARTCTTSPIEPGQTLSLVETLAPSSLARIKTMTVSATATRLSPATDVNTLNNRAIVHVAIQDSVVLG